MNPATPRMRMFAGPNGSGKSTSKGVIEPELLGVYINPDDIEKDIRRFDFLDFAAYGVETTAYIFDNSSHEKVWVAEITEGDDLEMKTDTMPHWFKLALWDKFVPPEEFARWRPSASLNVPPRNG